MWDGRVWLILWMGYCESKRDISTVDTSQCWIRLILKYITAWACSDYNSSQSI